MGHRRSRERGREKSREERGSGMKSTSKAKVRGGEREKGAREREKEIRASPLAVHLTANGHEAVD